MNDSVHLMRPCTICFFTAVIISNEWHKVVNLYPYYSHETRSMLQYANDRNVMYSSLHSCTIQSCIYSVFYCSVRETKLIVIV